MTLTELTPFELNKFRFSGRKTPLTPQQIEAQNQTAVNTTTQERGMDSDNNTQLADK